MEEKVLSGRKIGMTVLLGYILLSLLAIAGIIIGSMDSILLLLVSTVFLAFGWIVLLGLKVLKPQEALVLTLFGKYYGTLKGEGFYWVNPFCSAVNPAANTRLNQSADVNGGGVTVQDAELIQEKLLGLDSLS